ncbi:MAG: TonB family protein [Candidatus Eisenbacteria bacterium]
MQKFRFLVCGFVLAGCSGMPSRQTPAPAADSAHAAAAAAAAESAPGALRPLAGFDPATLPPARVAFVRVSPRREGLHVPSPAPEAAAPEPHAEVPAIAALTADDELRAPILRDTVRVDRARARRGWVELDVRVDEDGAVSDAMFAEGAADSAAVEAAIEAALAMKYWPAVRSGRAVAVWCRQRFEFGR